jgi:hypothetical protein
VRDRIFCESEILRLAQNDNVKKLVFFNSLVEASPLAKDFSFDGSGPLAAARQGPG